MPDSDKFSTLIELGILIGGGLLGLLGLKGSRKEPVDTMERIKELEEERQKLLSDAMEARIIDHIKTADANQTAARDMGLKANRALFFETFEKYHNERDAEASESRKKIDSIDSCVRRLEIQLTTACGEIEVLKSRRPAR